MAVEIVEELVRTSAEHEVFLVFDKDSDAELFHEWWISAGLESFTRFLEDYE
ncbi:MAG: hypothetical protein KBD25_03955 [Rickettsiaceae bacterium]|nr:hypothetical protein [Rickettsiaceae bacterium]